MPHKWIFTSDRDNSLVQCVMIELRLPPLSCSPWATSLLISTSRENKQQRRKGEAAQASRFLALLAVLAKTWWEKNYYCLKWDPGSSVAFNFLCSSFAGVVFLSWPYDQIQSSQPSPDSIASLAQSTVEQKNSVQILEFSKRQTMISSSFNYSFHKCQHPAQLQWLRKSDPTLTVEFSYHSNFPQPSWRLVSR